MDPTKVSMLFFGMQSQHFDLQCLSLHWYNTLSAFVGLFNSLMEIYNHAAGQIAHAASSFTFACHASRAFCTVPVHAVPPFRSKQVHTKVAQVATATSYAHVVLARQMTAAAETKS